MTSALPDPSPFATKHASGMWEDKFGAIGPFKPGEGPRQDPLGDFPTGPAIGERLPDIVTPTHTGDTLDVHDDRGKRAAVIVFYRSAVW